MDKNKDSENIIGQIKKYMKDFGNKENSMDKEK